MRDNARKCVVERLIRARWNLDTLQDLAGDCSFDQRRLGAANVEAQHGSRTCLRCLVHNPPRARRELAFGRRNSTMRGWSRRTKQLRDSRR